MTKLIESCSLGVRGSAWLPVQGRRVWVALACCGLFVLLGVLPTVAQETKIAPAVTLKVVTDRDNALYKLGEKATFTITASTDNGAVADQDVEVTLSEDGYKPQPAKKMRLVSGQAQVTGQLDKPGFLLVKATLGKTSSLAAAGYDPLEIPPSMPLPDDFDQYWSAQRANLAAVPMQPTITPVESPIAGVEAFDVQVNCCSETALDLTHGNGCAPVSGYLGKPIGARPKSLPAILFVHGAGVNSASLGSVRWATEGKGMLTMDINAHGLPNGKPAAFYQELAQGELKDYRTRERLSRDKVYFRGMFVRLMRALDFLTSQPEWDGKHLIVYGSSQGGFQALVAAGLDQRVTCICAGVPAGCDHTGSQVNRISGWPKLVAVDDAGHPVSESLTACRYFDAVNFARRAKCQTAAVTVGFIDTTCPPTSVYAAYNALTMTKTIHADVLAGHTNTPAASKFMQAAALRHCQE